MAKTLTVELIQAKCRTDRLSFIKNLNLWGNDLADVSVLSQLPNLEILSLSVNRISSLFSFQNLTKLKELYLRKNEIYDFEELQYLKKLPNLKILSLSENPIANFIDYRKIIIEILPNLEKLDEKIISVEFRPEEKTQFDRNAFIRQSSMISNFVQNDDNFYGPRKTSQDRLSNNRKSKNLNDSFENDNNGFNFNGQNERKSRTNYESFDHRFGHSTDNISNLSHDIYSDEKELGFSRKPVHRSEHVQIEYYKSANNHPKQSSLSPLRKNVASSMSYVLDQELRQSKIEGLKKRKIKSKNEEIQAIADSIKNLMTILNPFELEILKTECEKRLSKV